MALAQVLVSRVKEMAVRSWRTSRTGCSHLEQFYVELVVRFVRPALARGVVAGEEPPVRLSLYVGDFAAADFFQARFRHSDERVLRSSGITQVKIIVVFLRRWVAKFFFRVIPTLQNCFGWRELFFDSSRDPTNIL